MATPHLVEVAQWLGQGAAPLDPNSLQFKSKLAGISGGCKGCCFRYQNSSICKAASAAAVRANMPDCDDRDSETGRSFVYVLVQIDPRQADITDRIWLHLS